MRIDEIVPAFDQAAFSAEFILVANPGTPLIMLAASRLGIEPEATFLRFLASSQIAEVVVDFDNEFLG